MNYSDSHLNGKETMSKIEMGTVACVDWIPENFKKRGDRTVNVLYYICKLSWELVKALDDWKRL